ncbi:MAG: hypothetical protein K6C41_08195 [Lachnospiraceae bacterium]|nr:hypothetical protein [Lachnospiraceae bacterium]
MDELSRMIDEIAGKTPPESPEKMADALKSLGLFHDAEKDEDVWIKRYHELPSYPLDVVRDDSDTYIEALKNAIVAITKGDYGSVDYKGYKIYYDDTPHVKSVSVKDGHKEYLYMIRFHCDLLNMESYEEYHSEGEREAFLYPGSYLFEKTIALLDRTLEHLDNGIFIKKRKKLEISDFKDYSSYKEGFVKTEWDDREKSASATISYLMDDAKMRAGGYDHTEDDFRVFSDIIRRMVFFADHGKRYGRCALERLVMDKWEPETKHDRYIRRCMEDYFSFALPDELVDNCSLYYFMADPQGWEALAYVLPIIALSEMNYEYEPDHIKDIMLKAFDLIPNDGYREKIEVLIAQDREKAKKEGGNADDQEDI